MTSFEHGPWGCRNLVQKKNGSQESVREEVAKTLGFIIAEQKKPPGSILNLVVEGKLWDNLLQNGMRSELMLSKDSNAITPMWDALGVECHRLEDLKKQTKSEMLKATSDGSHIRLVRIVEGATSKAVAEGSTCKHSRLCIRTDPHTKMARAMTRRCPPRAWLEDESDGKEMSTSGSEDESDDDAED